jgi:2-polyprenyl-3-methyl-5-hydroxy-6-metoxy-1,4-benzoquinol methylase
MIHYRLHHDPRSSHQQIAALVRQLRVGPVLDVGAAQGMLGQLLQGEELEIDAVEPNPQWAEAARAFYRQMYVGTIESVALPRNFYRVLVCADVLEHTVDPIGVIGQLRQHATGDATFIISLPNVAHLSVRLMLLAGMFPKMQRGILDRTHLHFFTHSTAVQMLREAGLEVQRTLATPVPLEELARGGTMQRVLRAVGMLQAPFLTLLPPLFAFQWIFVASARRDPVSRSG